MAVICSASEESNHAFRDYVPDSFIYNSFDESILNRIFARQQNVMAAIEAGQSNIDPRTLLIADDIGYDTKALRSKAVNQLFLNGRHHKITFWASLQDSVQLTPSLRGNTDYLMFFSQPTGRERIYKMFFQGLLPNFATFAQVFDAVTEDYGVLVLDQTSRSNKLTDMLFHYKATIRPKFRFGSADTWRYHEAVYKAPSMLPSAATSDDSDNPAYHNQSRPKGQQVRVVKLQ